MEIRTGYFAQYRKYKEAGYTMIGITRFPPKWFDGINLVELAPSSELLSSYKRGSISWEYFENYYLDYLKSNSNIILKSLKSLNYDKIVLCCFEKSTDPCHRHILSNYLNTYFGYNITEFTN